MKNTRDRKTYIYVLRDPRDMGIKYVGKTVNLAWRGKAHRSPYGESHCARWLKCLRDKHLHAVMEIIETIPAGGDWASRERYWIAYYREQGLELCNMSLGGEGECGSRLSEETKERLRQLFTGRPIPPEQRELISKSLTGKVQSPETVAKRLATINERRAQQGKPPLNLGESAKQHEREQRRQYKESVRIREGKPKKFSPEWKAKIAASLKARYESLPVEEQEAIKQSGHKGGGYWTGKKRAPWTAEQRAKRSEAMKAKLASLTPEQRQERMTAARIAQGIWVPPSFEEIPLG